MSYHHIIRVIPVPLLDLKLTDKEILFYGLVLGLASAYGYCDASDKYLAERTKSKIETVQKRIKKLEKLSLFRIEYGQYGFRKIFLPSF